MENLIKTMVIFLIGGGCWRLAHQYVCATWDHSKFVLCGAGGYRRDLRHSGHKEFLIGGEMVLLQEK